MLKTAAKTEARDAQQELTDGFHLIIDLKNAKRLLIILGKGAVYAQADDDIRALIEKSGIPFLPMSMAKGLLPDTHPQSTTPRQGPRQTLPSLPLCLLQEQIWYGARR
jgi:thiamine pyrophosphate-dependent acetolactate synthase large subunit-like protein